ncbi:MAG TPA: MBOAT family O-acyltransferase [Pirellulales bacterium]|nr:MBOAT family O-acyltransferase [Pirellulales bacterium]
MDQSTVDLYKPDFWCVLTVAVLVLTPLVSPILRKWAWAAINLVFLGVLLGYPAPERLRELLHRGAFQEAALFVGSSRLALVCGGVLAAWLVLKAIARLQAIGFRRLSMLPLFLGGVAVLGLFLLHKVHSQTLHDYDRYRELLEAAGLTSSRLQPLKSLLLAIGFSYVALRLVEALRLTYEGRHPAPDLPSAINYLLPFHMLAAGPIQAYSEFVAQPAVPPPLTASDALRGIERIAQGLFKKYVLATIVLRAFLTNGFQASSYLFGDMMFFYLWLYLDFSAYSDITVGAGRLMGVATPENFNRPYVARNLIDFWERWHMSLSRFIYRNVFIPVQLTLLRRTGPQRALSCAAVAFTVSFLLCGLWHELNVRWLGWGAMHALGLITVNGYRFWLQKHLSREAYNRYRTHRGIRMAAIALTQVFVALTLVVALWPTK